jgi:hypothetical protein
MRPKQPGNEVEQQRVNDEREEPQREDEQR